MIILLREYSLKISERIESWHQNRRKVSGDFLSIREKDAFIDAYRIWYCVELWWVLYPFNLISSISSNAQLVPDLHEINSRCLPFCENYTLRDSFAQNILLFDLFSFFIDSYKTFLHNFATRHKTHRFIIKWIKL